MAEGEIVTYIKRRGYEKGYWDPFDSGLSGACGLCEACPKKLDTHCGSRADATVKLSYEYDPRTEIPQVNEAQAFESAQKRCSSWGYSDVEAFGGVIDLCTQFGYAFGGPE